MATEKQKKAVEHLIENGGNKRQALKDAGYSQSIADNPKKVTESKGFKELTEEIGLTPSFVLDALRYDIEHKPKNRGRELELATKVLGLSREKLEVEHSGKISLSELFDAVETTKE